MADSSQERFGRVAERYLTSKDHALPDSIAGLVEGLEPMHGLVLDIGTGAGHTAYALAARAERVAAVDITPEMLEIVARESSARGLTNVEVVESPAESLPFKNGSVTGVACRLAAHHFLDVDAFVGECARVVAPGGWVLLIDTVSPESAEAAEIVNRAEAIRDPSHGRNLSPSEWMEKYASAGFQIESHILRDKRMDYIEWMDRQDVPASDRPELDRLIMESTGDVGAYFKPELGDRLTFVLQELTLIARKP